MGRVCTASGNFILFQILLDCKSFVIFCCGNAVGMAVCHSETKKFFVLAMQESSPDIRDKKIFRLVAAKRYFSVPKQKNFLSQHCIDTIRRCETKKTLFQWTVEHERLPGLRRRSTDSGWPKRIFHLQEDYDTIPFSSMPLLSVSSSSIGRRHRSRRQASLFRRAVPLFFFHRERRGSE